MGRHYSNDHNRGRRGTVPLALMIVAVLAAGIAATTLRFTGSTARCADGTQTLHVGSDSAALDWLREFAGEYNAARRPVDGHCVHVDVGVMDAERVAATLRAAPGRDGGARPDVWVAESSARLDLVRGEQGNAATLPARAPSVASSPLVLAAPPEAVRALHLDGVHTSALVDLLQTGQNGAGWAAAGHPDWGPVRISFADPSTSAVGTSLVVGVAAAMSGVPVADVTPKTFADLRTRAGLRAFAHATAVRARSRDDLLDQVENSAGAAEEIRSLGFLVLTEQDVWRHNSASPAVPLQAVYPFGGGLAADFPYVVPASAGGSARAAAQDFHDWLAGPSVQRRLADFGLRTADGAGAPLAAAERGVSTTPLTPVAAHDVTAPVTARASWRTVTRRVSTLAVIDVSGSMGQTVRGANLTRLQLAARAALAALPFYGDEDHVGMWEFSTNLDGHDYRELVPVGPAAGSFAGVSRRTALERAYQSLTPQHMTALYDTVLAAYDSALRSYQPGFVNTVVVLTDGANEDPDSVSLQMLLTELKKRQDRARPVHVVAIGYGEQAGVDVLRQIAQVTGGIAFATPDPRDIGKVFLTALSSLGE